MPSQCSSPGDRRVGSPAGDRRVGPAAGYRRVGVRLAVTCGAVVLAAAPLAAGPAAAASAAGALAGQVSVVITSVTPDVATPGKPVTVSGTVSNTTARAVSGLSVQIRSSGSALTSRGDLTNYATGNLPAGSPVAGAVASLPGSLGSGSTESWSVSLSAHELGLTAFGVYPLAAEVDGAGVPLDTDRSFLPFWPGRSTLAGPLQIAWVWPVIDAPQQAACGALLNSSLAASVAPGGRLAGLLAAGSTPAASSADLTWAIDPGLLSSAEAITKPYRAGGSQTCAGTTVQPASTAARNWLAGLTAATAKQDFFVTTYDDVDVAALTHQGMDSDLTHAFNEGRSAARSILGSAQRPATAATDQEQGHVSLPAGIGGIAWPADGIADYGVLGNLAVNGVGTVILDSSLMPPVTQVSYTPSAVTQTPDGVGSVLHVALADHTLTQILASAPAPAIAGSATARATTAGAAFATEQRFLAETAMIAAEAPALRRSIVVAPPREWDPASGVASALLSETVRAPWLSPVSLTDLVTADSTAGQVPRQQPAQQLVSRSELSASLLGQVQQLDKRLRLHGSILDPPNPAYLAKAVAAVESSAWRGPTGAGQASRLLARVSAYLASREQLVTIIDASRVTLGGQSGSIPVSIRNRLTQAVTLRLEVQAPSNSGITILPYHKTVTIAAGSLRTVAVHVQAAAAGTTTLRLSLLTTGNAPLPYGASTLTVDATHFGTLALVIIGIAVGVFVLTAAGRAFRRGGGPRGGAAAGGGGGPADDADGPDPPSGPSEPVAIRPATQPPPTGPAAPGPPADAPAITEPFTIWPEPAEQASPPAEPGEYARWPG